MRIRYQIALALAGLGLIWWLVRHLATMALSGKSTKICPQCGSCYINPSGTRAGGDWLFRLFGWLAYRCKVCNYRFYRPRYSTT
jgi:hypothetical protein